jgi:acetyl-CoA acetyltransferase
MGANRFARKYAIAGLGLVTPFPEGITLRAAEAEAGRLAIEDAGLTRADIGGAIRMGRGGGRGDRASFTDGFPRMLGLPYRFYYTVSRGGGHAALGIMAALSALDLGLANYVLICGGVDDRSKAEEAKGHGHRGMVNIEKEGYWGGPFGDLRAVTHHTFLAARHMHDYGTTSRQLGAISVQQRAWAQKNPRARMYGKAMTIEDHQASPMVVDPYHLFDLCVISDGAVAFVLTTAERARACRKPPVYLLGLGTGEVGESLWWEKKNYNYMAVRTAKEHAFGMAGIELADVDFAQLYDCFTGEVLFQIEDYGWAEKGQGGPFVEAGRIGPGGEIPVNTGGGLLSAYHLSDLTGLSEAVDQLRGEAGERQIAGAEVGLVTGHGGELTPGMCSIHTTLVLGR